MKPKPFDVPGADADRSRSSARSLPASPVAGHTPGPWGVRMFRRFAEVHAAAEKIADVEYNITDEDITATKARHDANAALIALAPNMRRALSIIASWEPPDRDGHGHTWEDMVELADKTLKGEAPDVLR